MKKATNDLVELDNGKCVKILPNRIEFLSNKDSVKKNQVDISIPTIKKEEETHLTILTTYNCNLRCIYCYSKGGEEKSLMKEGLVKDVLDYFRKKSNKIHIRFTGGGEPFMNFKLMKFCISYAKKIFDEVSIHTITNGTFNEEQFNWLKENNSFVRVSFDGLAQSFQRPFNKKVDSTKIVEDNLKKIIKTKIPFSVQTTITSKSVRVMNEIVQYLYDLGARDIKLEPVYISAASRGREDLMCTAREYAEAFISLIKYLKTNSLNVLIDTSFFSRPSTGYYCTMPEGNDILTPEGYLTSCVEISKKSEPFSELLLYSKWDSQKKRFVSDKTKMEKLRKFHFSNSNLCVDCNLRLLCKGGCPMRTFWKMENGQTQHEYSCEISKILVPALLNLIFIDKSYATYFLSGYKIKNEKKN